MSAIRRETDALAGGTEFTGAEARRVAAAALPAINRYGAGRGVVMDAVKLIERSREPTHLFAIARVAGVPPGFLALDKLPAGLRVALEMAAHEETERRAMEGELAVLEQAWRDAEEIAGIADALLPAPDPNGVLRRA